MLGKEVGHPRFAGLDLLFYSKAALSISPPRAGPAVTGLECLRGHALFAQEQHRRETEKERERVWESGDQGRQCLRALTQTSQVPGERGQRGAAGHWAGEKEMLQKRREKRRGGREAVLFEESCWDKSVCLCSGGTKCSVGRRALDCPFPPLDCFYQILLCVFSHSVESSSYDIKVWNVDIWGIISLKTVMWHLCEYFILSGTSLMKYSQVRAGMCSRAW